MRIYQGEKKRIPLLERKPFLVLKMGGLYSALKYVFSHSFGYFFYKILRSKQNFRFQGQDYDYFIHQYNTTWMNERMVEIPVMWELVKRYPPEEILEIGNVLSHYFSIRHDTVDKYENAVNVINRDAVDYITSKSYKLIISISTFEHIGWDELPRDQTKIYRVIDNLSKLMKPNGRIVITFPLGYNPNLDRIFFDDENGYFSERLLLRKDGGRNLWMQDEVKKSTLKPVCYEDPFLFTKELAIGVICNGRESTSIFQKTGKDTSYS